VASDAKLHAPATTRNREAIATVLEHVLPEQGTVLEIASGTGEHAIFFAERFPAIQWQPTEREPSSLASIAAWSAERAPPNLLPPLAFDVCVEPWAIAEAAAIVCINMIHIAPWEACEALLRGAAQVLPSGGLLYLYGPYKLGGKHTAPSNEQFDQWLKQSDPRWGVRDAEEVARTAATRGFNLEDRVPMPANNQSLVFRKRVDLAPPQT
jgi:hypothetical protein